MVLVCSNVIADNKSLLCHHYIGLNYCWILKAFMTSKLFCSLNFQNKTNVIYQIASGVHDKKRSSRHL